MDVGCVLVWGKDEKDPLVFHTQTSFSDRAHAAQTLSTS